MTTNIYPCPRFSGHQFLWTQTLAAYTKQKMAFITYVYLLAVIFVADSMQSSYLPCDGKPKPTNVKILGCNTLPCNLKRGTYVEAAIDFVTKDKTKTLKPDVDVELGSVHVKYPFPEQNACKGLTNGQCPLEKNQPATYYMKMPVEKAYPKISLTIQFSLVDEHNKSQVCIKIPAKVVD